MDEEQLWIKSDYSLRSVTMVSRRKILSRSRDDLNLEAPPEEEEDIWYNRDKLYKVSDTERMKNIIFQHYCCSVWYCIHKIHASTVWLKEDDYPQGFWELKLWIERICATDHMRMKNIIFTIAVVYCVIRYDDQWSPGWAGSHQMVTSTAPLQSCVSVMSKYSLFFNVTMWGAPSSAHQQYLVSDTGVHYYLQVYNPRLGHCTGGHCTTLCTGHSHINTVPQ